MIGYLLVALILVIGAAIVLFNLWIKAIKASDSYKAECGNLRRDLASTRLQLEEVKEIYARSDAQKKAVNSGTPDNRFAASLGVLSDIARTGAGASSR